MKLGPSYWKVFFKINQYLIETKKNERFKTKRSEWCAYHNMIEMYNEVYSHLVEAGHTVKNPEPAWRDGNGDAVVEEWLAFGQKSPFELIHPDWVSFVDEMGSNTSQTKDGQVGGRNFCVEGRAPAEKVSHCRCTFYNAWFHILLWTILSNLFANHKPNGRLASDCLMEHLSSKRGIELNKI